MGNSRLWLGAEGGDILVYDPDIQVEGSEFVLLWNRRTGDIEVYLATLLRTNIRRAELSRAAGAESAYSAWRSSSEVALQEERAYLTARLAKDRQERLEKEARKRQEQ